MQGRLRSAAGPRNRITKRVGLAVAALGAGVVIGLVDSSPGWDDTGITAGLLFLAAAGTTVLARGRTPWLWAALVGLPTPVLAIAQSGNTGSLLALAFAAIGATSGWAVARATAPAA